MSRSEDLRSAAAAAIGGSGSGRGGAAARSGATNWAQLSVRVTDPTLSPSGYTLYKITVTDRAASRAVQCVWRRFKECEEVFQVMCRAQAEAMAAGPAYGAGRLPSPGGASSRTPSVVSSVCTRGSEQLQQPSPAAAAAHATPLYAQFARTFAKKAFSRFSEETIEKRRKGIEAFAKYVIAASCGDGDDGEAAAAAAAALDGAAVSGPVCLKQENYFADPALPGATTGDDEELQSAAKVSEGSGGGDSDRIRHDADDEDDDDDDDDDDDNGGDDCGEDEEDASLPRVLADTRAFVRLLGMAPRGAGYMSKMGKTTMGIRGAFKLRWFELHPAERPRELAYMRRPSSEERRGAIPLHGGVSIVDQQSNRYPHSFCIMGAHLPRTYLLMAPSEATKRDWVQLLSEVVAENNARNPPTAAAVTTSAASSSATSASGYAAAGAAAARSVLGAPRKGFKALWGRVTEAPQEQQQQPAKAGQASSAGDEAGCCGVSLQEYSLLCIVGIGSFGKVLKVAKKDAEGVRRVYAMKVIEKDLVVRNKMVFHTISEKEVLEKAAHPFIVRLHRSFQTRKQLVLVMDFLSGGELFFHLQREKRFGEERARVYSAEIALALSHLHGMDIIYRDLKSENLVLDCEGHLVLTDFGLAKVDMPRDGRAHTFCGTPEYMAPELVRKDGHTFSVDFWSLGILLYEMAAGSPPFFAKTLPEMYHAILHQPLRMPAHFSSDLGDLLRALIERDPAARLSSASAMQKHAFYDGLSFSDVLQKKVPVPWLPATADEDDTKYFSTEFTTQPLTEQVLNLHDGANSTDVEFAGFEQAVA